MMIVDDAEAAAEQIARRFESESKFRKFIDQHIFWTHRVPGEIVEFTVKEEKND